MLLSKDNLYYGYYDHVNGLQVSDPVAINGVKIGYVKEIDISGSEQVRVVFAIDSKHLLQKGTIASISQGDFTGSKTVNLKAGAGPGTIPDNGMINTALDSTLMELFHANVEPIIYHGLYVLRSTDSALQSFNYIIVSGWGTRTQNEIEKFTKVTGNFATASAGANRRMNSLSATFAGVADKTADPASKNADINSKLSKAEGQAAKLAGSNLHESLQGVNNTLGRLSGSIKTISKNPLLNDKKPYNDFSQSLDTLNTSLKQLQKDPPGIRLFGGKKKRN
jgi:phospholipid/cholesterol/gamma-HCH transport system substrate-binding protein